MGKEMRIFGKTVALHCADTAGSDRLHRELSLYPPAGSGGEELSLAFRRTVAAPQRGLVNPSIHHDATDGFVADYVEARVRHRFEEGRLRAIEFALAPRRMPALDGLRRMLSIEYSAPSERVGQIFHELVMVPSVFFDEERALVHASACQAPDGGVLLIGGTGGAGKTSLELELCLRHGYRFVADDIAVLARDGSVAPNLAYPKIYAYNVRGEPNLRASLVSRRDPMDRLHWWLHGRRGPGKVRRRISPEALYGAYSSAGGPASRYLFLVREHRDDVLVEESTPARLATLGGAVIAAEYGVFLNHVRWHEINRAVARAAPQATHAQLLDRLESTAAAGLRRAECSIVRLPFRADHRRMKRRVLEAIGVGSG